MGGAPQPTTRLSRRRHPRRVPPPPRWSQDHSEFTRCDTKFSVVPTTSTTQRAYAHLTNARPFPNMRHKLDCAPKLRQSEFGHSSANGEGDVRRAKTKVGPLAGGVPA